MARSLIWIVLLPALALSACGRAASPPSATEAPLSQVYTAVAVTLTAQAASFTVTLTSSLTPSPTPQASPSATPTTQQSQNVNASSYANTCDNSVYVSDVTIPDGSIVAPGQTFVKTWLLQNTGTCTWSSSYSLIFFSGDTLSGSETEIGQTVSPGQQAKISVSLTAPETYGSYTGYWKLANEQGSAFGTSVYVQIVVSDSAASLTPTTESSSTSTATSLPSSTPTVVPSTSPDTPSP